MEGSDKEIPNMLSGVRVLDFTQYLAGPTVTRLMAEMGADIIKVEQAPMGDPARLLPAVTNGRSGYFVQQNRGKQSLCLDFCKAGVARRFCASWRPRSTSWSRTSGRE